MNDDADDDNVTLRRLARDQKGAIEVSLVDLLSFCRKSSDPAVRASIARYDAENEFLKRIQERNK